MATYVPQKWPKFPVFMRYANERAVFQQQTRSATIQALDLSLEPFSDPSDVRQYVGGARPASGGRRGWRARWRYDCPWEPKDAWRALRDHQGAFQALLDGIITGTVAPGRLQGLTEHCAHLVIQSHWVGPWPVELRSFLRYEEVIRAQDPLDGIYGELREYLRRGGESRLKKCPVCSRYFVQATARAQTYCETSCQLKGNPTRQARNAAYQRQHRARDRAKRIRADLTKVREAKSRLGQDPRLESVLEEAGIGQRRWTTLRQWEINQYGKSRVTDLTS